MNGTSIVDTIPGGPGFNSRQLVPGDVILRIDGVPVMHSTINTALIGNDVTGTPVVLTIAKGGSEVDYAADYICFPWQGIRLNCSIPGICCQRPGYANGLQRDPRSSANV